MAEQHATEKCHSGVEQRLLVIESLPFNSAYFVPRTVLMSGSERNMTRISLELLYCENLRKLSPFLLSRC